MKNILITTIAAVLLVGCGESQQSAPAPEAKPVEPVAEAAQQEPTTAKVPDISIHKAAFNGNIEAVKQHLAAGTDMNAEPVDPPFGTPFVLAVHSGHKEIVELLIAEGADVNLKDQFDSTPLHEAVTGGHKDIAELLIANGADVNAKNDNDGTPLRDAAEGGHKEIAELLIAEGADVNAKGGIAGGTPLHGAVTFSHKEIVELLIAKGADVNVKDGDGDTPLDFAVKYKRTEIADLLRKHGGKTGDELKAEQK